MRWRFGSGVIAAALLVIAAGPPPTYSMPVPQLAPPGPGGERIDVPGVVGNYYPGAASGRHPAILALGGSEGGIGGGLVRQAQALQAAGYSVLALSYFGGPGQPPALDRVPLETFDRALAWLAHRPGVDPARIGVIGGSKGAEAALIVATRHPELKAVVAGMPSSVAWPAIGGAGGRTGGGASWSLGGTAVEPLPYGSFDPATGVFGLYSSGLAQLGDHPGAAIPIERATAPVLLICGEADTLWPSCPMARQLATRAKQHPPVAVLAYPDAGHAVYGVPLAADDPRVASLAGLGGTVDGNAAARRDGWPRALDFLGTALSP